jgi:3-dehydroquinate synthase
MAHGGGSHPERSIRVQLGERSYDAVVGAGLLDTLGSRVRRAIEGRAPKRCVLVHDAALPRALIGATERSLNGAGFAVASLALDATEREKSLANAGRVCGILATTKVERHEPVVALGGGIVGDLAGFAAAIYRRGVPVVQCPTTLLSMVDAAVGGKTGANLEVPGTGGLLKNFIGAFHQPMLVVADVETLDSLPDRHVRAGLAECIKHALLASDVEAPGAFEQSLLERTEVLVGRVIARDRGAMTELIARNIAIKARVIAGDEREMSTDPSGGRAALNLGHTFGHAIETLPGLTPDGDVSHAPLHHGEAVGLGVHAACRCAVVLGTLQPAEADRVERLLRAAGLPSKIPGLPPGDELLERMAHDKKVADGSIRLVLPIGLGHVRIVEGPDPAVVKRAWDSIRV